MKQIKDLKDKLPLNMRFIIDEFEDGIYLVGVYENGIAPHLKKSLRNPTQEQKEQLQIDCLTEYFKYYLKQKLKKVINRKQFLEDLAVKLKVELSSIEWYFRKRMPTEHINYVNSLLDEQIKIDKKTREYVAKAWEKL